MIFRALLISVLLGCVASIGCEDLSIDRAYFRCESHDECGPSFRCGEHPEFDGQVCVSDQPPQNHGGRTDRVPFGAELRHTSPDGCRSDGRQCGLHLAMDINRRLDVQLVDAEDRPVGNVEIHFEVHLDGDDAADVASPSVRTDDNGVATVNLNSGSVTGIGEVTANADDTDLEVSWLLVVSDADTDDGALFVEIDNPQGLQLDRAEVDLYDLSTALDWRCDGPVHEPVASEPIATETARRDEFGAFPMVAFAEYTSADLTLIVRGYSSGSSLEGYGCLSELVADPPDTVILHPVEMHPP